MSPAFAAGKKARGFCDRCGFNYRLHELHPQVIDMVATGLLVCPECLDEDQPQLQLGRWPVDDPQALRNARPAGQEGGRDENSLVFDFKTDDEGFEVSEGTLTYNSSEESVTWEITSAVESTATFHHNLLVVNTALYRYVRMRVKFLELPSPLDWRGRLSWARYSTSGGAFDIPIETSSPEFYQMGSDYHDIIWDMDDDNVDGAVNYPWTGAVKRVRVPFFTLTAGSAFKIEILGVHFEPAIYQPENSLQYGITNYDFSTPVFNRVRYPRAYTSQQGGIDSVPGWTVEAAPAEGSGSGVMGVYLYLKSLYSTSTQDEIQNQYLFISPYSSEMSASQVTSTVIEADTKYTLKVNVLHRNDQGAPKYAVKMKADGSVIAQDANTLTISSGGFVTSTVEYTAVTADVGKYIEIELENASTLNLTATEGQVGFDNVRLTSYPQLTYDFLSGTATETSGSGTYGIEGWAHWNQGDHPIEDSLTWDASAKTVTLATPSLGVSNPWTSPFFTYWGTPSPGVSADVSTTRFSSLTIRMRRVTAGVSTTGTWRGRFYWVQQARVDDGLYAFSANVVATEPVFTIDEWQDVTWDMGSNPDWYNEGTATGFRFDFYVYTADDTDTKDIFEVDYVRFT